MGNKAGKERGNGRRHVTDPQSLPSIMLTAQSHGTSSQGALWTIMSQDSVWMWGGGCWGRWEHYIFHLLLLVKVLFLGTLSLLHSQAGQVWKQHGTWNDDILAATEGETLGLKGRTVTVRHEARCVWLSWFCRNQGWNVPCVQRALETVRLCRSYMVQKSCLMV